MAKEIYILEGSDVTYKASIGKQVIKLSTSDSDTWNNHAKNVTKGHIKDDGDKIIVNFKDKEVELQYDEIGELYTLLDLKMKSDKNMSDNFTYLIEEKNIR
jgi:hypothetical protein